MPADNIFTRIGAACVRPFTNRKKTADLTGPERAEREEIIAAHFNSDIRLIFTDDHLFQHISQFKERAKRELKNWKEGSRFPDMVIIRDALKTSNKAEYSGNYDIHKLQRCLINDFGIRPEIFTKYILQSCALGPGGGLAANQPKNFEWIYGAGVNAAVFGIIVEADLFNF
ncbi:hypothetical protein ABW21_db0206564 [Orbilia brochopaga]|nr:hypothetical protein ABW21_db0206564 [Drechslerella brochopaga]